MARPPRFDPRKLMEQAIEVMRQSVSEPRGDGKASPRVGAVIWKPDGRVETACRGELRQGDHAEFTLLERKCRGVDELVLLITRLCRLILSWFSNLFIDCTEYSVHKFSTVLTKSSTTVLTEAEILAEVYR